MIYIHKSSIRKPDFAQHHKKIGKEVAATRVHHFYQLVWHSGSDQNHAS
jgi:hypothetical protein